MYPSTLEPRTARGAWARITRPPAAWRATQFDGIRGWVRWYWLVLVWEPVLRAMLSVNLLYTSNWERLSIRRIGLPWRVRASRDEAMYEAGMRAGEKRANEKWTHAVERQRRNRLVDMVEGDPAVPRDLLAFWELYLAPEMERRRVQEEVPERVLEQALDLMDAEAERRRGEGE